MPKSSLHGCTTRNGNVARAYSVHPLPLTYRLSALRAGLSTVAYSRGSEHTARACNACVCVQKQIRMDGEMRERCRERYGGVHSLC